MVVLPAVPVPTAAVNAASMAGSRDVLPTRASGVSSPFVALPPRRAGAGNEGALSPHPHDAKTPSIASSIARADP